VKRLATVCAILAAGGIAYAGVAAALRVSDVASFLSAMRRGQGGPDGTESQ